MVWQGEATPKSIAPNLTASFYHAHDILKEELRKLLSHQAVTHRIALVSCKPLLGKAPAQKTGMSPVPQISVLFRLMNVVGQKTCNYQLPRAYSNLSITKCAMLLAIV